MRQVVRDPAQARALPARTSRCTPTTAATSRRAEQEVRGDAGARTACGLLALALRADRTGPARPTRRRPTRSSAKLDAQGASYAASGLGDLALYEGRLRRRGAHLRRGRRRRRRGEGSRSGGEQSSPRSRIRAAAAAAERRGDRGGRAGAGQQQGRQDPLPGRARVCRGGRDRERAHALAAGLAAELQAEPQAYAKIIEGEAALSKGDAREAIKLLDRGQRAARHLDRPLRPRPRLSRRRRLHAGRLGVRSLHQAARRGAGAVPRRGADLRLLPAGLLLPGPRAGRAAERRLRRFLPRVSRHPRAVEGRSPAARGPPPRHRPEQLAGARASATSTAPATSALATRSRGDRRGAAAPCNSPSRSASARWSSWSCPS